MRRKLLALLISAVAFIVLFINHNSENLTGWPIYEYILKDMDRVPIPNVVTAVYLHYRYYDTLFEALLLLFSIIAIIYLSVHEEEYHE